MQPGMSVSFVGRPAGVSPSQLFNWRRRILEGEHAAVQMDEDVVGTSRIHDLEKRVRDLKHLRDRKTIENEILEEALDLVRPENGRRLCCPGATRRTVLGSSAVAQSLDVACSRSRERRGRTVTPRRSIPQGRGGRVPGADLGYRRCSANLRLPLADRRLLAIDERRRLTVLLKRCRRAERRSTVNE